MATQDPQVHLDALELAALLRPAWQDISVGIPGWHPRAEGDADADTAVVDKDDSDDDAQEDAEPVKADDDWQAKARKHERDAKRLRKENERLAREAQERESANKTDRQKELDDARKEARQEALSEAEKDRRHDRLEVASTRLAARGFQIGEGDDAQTAKFADPDDALIYLDRAIRSGDVDEADIFDEDGKVQNDALQTALADILDNKPHLRASENGNGRPKGSPDTRRGAAVDKDLEAMGPEDHARRKYGAPK